MTDPNLLAKFKAPASRGLIWARAIFISGSFEYASAGNRIIRRTN
jgi:hypothetical protein